MNLVLDIGNTAVKYALFEGNRIMLNGIVNGNDVNGILSDVNRYTVQKAIISAVSALPKDLDMLLQKAGSYFFFDENTPVPIRNAYETPATLGRDRLANACAAHEIFPDSDVLVIDAGTCLKFDVLTANGVYLGGAISPGLMMRFQALHHYTENLPLLQPVTSPGLTGSSTQASIQSGVVNGMIAEIEGVVRQYQVLYPRLELVITGGDAAFFLNHLKSRIFADPLLTLKGLHTILLFQAHE